MKRANLTRIMGRAAAVIGVMLLAGPVLASSEISLQEFRPDYGNIPAMQRGARDFMAYCSGCHSMKYLRYSRMAKDLNIPEDLLKANLMFGTKKVGDTINSAMPAESEQWFGVEPPDLSLEARARGASWIYSYLQGFYLDDTRPLGVNNTVLKGSAMPDVLWELQGWQKLVEAPAAGESAAGEQHGSHFQAVTQGKLSPEKFQAFVGDITTFMDYAAEPGKRARIHTGFKVILFLILLTILTYLLKKEFWRDVH